MSSIATRAIVVERCVCACVSSYVRMTHEWVLCILKSRTLNTEITNSEYCNHELASCIRMTHEWVLWIMKSRTQYIYICQRQRERVKRRESGSAIGAYTHTCTSVYVHTYTHTHIHTYTHEQAVAAAVVTCQLAAMLEELTDLETHAAKTIAAFEALTKRPTLYSLVYV